VPTHRDGVKTSGRSDKKLLDETIDLVSRAQEPSGYIGSSGGGTDGVDGEGGVGGGGGDGKMKYIQADKDGQLQQTTTSQQQQQYCVINLLFYDC